MDRIDDVFDEWDLHQDIVGEFRELARVAIHVGAREGMRRGETRRAARATDEGEMLAHVFRFFAPDKAERGKDAVDQPAVARPANVLQVRGGKKNLHASPRYNSRG